MKNAAYQKQYFKYMYINFPTLSYNEILLKLSKAFKVTKYYYTLKEFNICYN